VTLRMRTSKEVTARLDN